MKKTPDDIKLIDERINKMRDSKKDTGSSPFVYASATGLRITVELLSGTVIGAGIGYFLDDMFGTQPVLLITLLFLGGVAGFLNVYRFVKNEENKRG